MKGILLAGGMGTRLYPATHAVCKQLLPVYDKPLIYYPLSVLMLMDIRDILIITNQYFSPQLMFGQLGDGIDFGINLKYIIQPEPRGLPEALILGEQFLDGESACLALGDNIFFGNQLIESLNYLHECIGYGCGAGVFAYQVKDPQRYGVVEFKDDKVVSLEEKPARPRSNFAIPGIYVFDNTVSSRAAALAPSGRGELEILDLLKSYLAEDRLCVKMLGRGTAWLDAGTPESLLQASAFVQTIQERQGLQIGCLEEIAYQKGWITKDRLARRADKLGSSEYGAYLKFLLDNS